MNELVKIEFWDNENWISEDGSHFVWNLFKEQSYKICRPIFVDDISEIIEDDREEKQRIIQEIFGYQYKLEFYCRENEYYGLSRMKHCENVIFYFDTGLKHIPYDRVEMESENVEDTEIRKITIYYKISKTIITPALRIPSSYTSIKLENSVDIDGFGFAGNYIFDEILYKDNTFEHTSGYLGIKISKNTLTDTIIINSTIIYFSINSINIEGVAFQLDDEYIYIGCNQYWYPFSTFPFNENVVFSWTGDDLILEFKTRFDPEFESNDLSGEDNEDNGINIPEIQISKEKWNFKLWLNEYDSNIFSKLLPLCDTVTITLKGGNVHILQERAEVEVNDVGGKDIREIEFEYINKVVINRPYRVN